MEVWGGERGGWVTCDARELMGRVWKEIRKEWETFIPDAVFSLGNGRRVCFWKDI